MNNSNGRAGHERCGGRTRRGTPCRLPAGHGTDHPGVGRCDHHGGATPTHRAHAERVLLERAEGTALAELGRIGVEPAERRNGRPPGRDLAILAAVLAAAVPELATVLPEVRGCWSAAGAEAGLAGRAPAGRFWLSSREVAALTGATDRGVRWACTTGRLRATRTPAGAWAIHPGGVDEWRARRASRPAA